MRSLYVCTKFQLSADRIQLFKGITGLEFTLRHWHKLFVEVSLYNAFNVYRRELAPGTVSLTGDRAQGDDSKHWANSTCKGNV